jgi:aspartyl-tRNA(Asn)/glutamyl-tRNA(Gln) amidotransferase subunit A
LRDQILTGLAIGAADYAEATDARHTLARMAQRCFSSLDVIAMPTVATMPPPISARYPAGELVALRQYTRFASCTGQPALSVPAGFTSLGMPIGLQFVGKHGQDDRLLHISETYETLRGWTMPLPPCSDPSAGKAVHS